MGAFRSISGILGIYAHFEHILFVLFFKGIEQALHDCGERKKFIKKIVKFVKIILSKIERMIYYNQIGRIC